MANTEQKGIKPLAIPLSDELQELMGQIFPKTLPSPNLYRIVAKNKGLFQDLIATQFIGPTGVFDKGRLAPKLRELVILRTCKANENLYEYTLHKGTISQKMGLTSQQIYDIWEAKVNPKIWDPSEVCLFELIDCLAHKKDINPQLYTSLKIHYTESILIEIILLVGFYTSVSMLVHFANPPLDTYTK